MLTDYCRLWLLAESRILLKEFEVQETELVNNLSALVTEHKELEAKVDDPFQLLANTQRARLKPNEYSAWSSTGRGYIVYHNTKAAISQKYVNIFLLQVLLGCYCSVFHAVFI